jgi:CheY-like chemotaxis protein
MPYGSVLVVDDIEANLYVTKGLLAFYEIHTETCNCGYAALEKIKNGNTYDIIFMDQTMPGITGTETMQQMREMGYDGIIIALTANALLGQAEEFIRSGFDGFISKPINTEHLNTILNKHIKEKQPPEVLASVSGMMPRRRASDIENFQDDASLLTRLRFDFVINQKNIFADITTAINEKDLSTAHRLAHSLKGLAGLIKEPKLANLALYAENQLSDMLKQSNFADLQTLRGLPELQAELTRVLAEIGEPKRQPQPAAKSTDKAAAQALFKELTPLLETKNIDAQELIPQLKKFPETAIIARQIEVFEFAAALGNLKILQEIIC